MFVSGRLTSLRLSHIRSLHSGSRRGFSPITSSRPASSHITLSPGLQVTGQSGRQYVVQDLLQEIETPQYRVCLAKCKDLPHHGTKFVVKNGKIDTFDWHVQIDQMVEGSPFLRTLQDTVPEHAIFVFEYLDQTILSPTSFELPVEDRVRVLKDVLRGIAALHAHDIVHADIKANNVLIDWMPGRVGKAIKRTQLSDIDDAGLVPPGQAIQDFQIGNQLWRSPEAHAEGRVNEPSDMFSFGILCTYAVTETALLQPTKGELEGGTIDPMAIILEKQMSYFAEDDDMRTFMGLIEGRKWKPIFEVIWDGFGTEYPKRPWRERTDLDRDFQDFVAKLTSFDPGKRMTAGEALKHPWMKRVG